MMFIIVYYELTKCMIKTNQKLITPNEQNAKNYNFISSFTKIQFYFFIFL